MPDPDPLDLDALAPEAIPGLRLLPVLHERVDLAPVVRAALDAADPAAVAVELPTTLADAAAVAARRLPRVTVVVSEEEGDEEALVWVAAPGDPLVEALRWAAEHERPALLVDPDVPYREHHRDPLPDPYALWALGPVRYLEMVEELLSRAPRGDADALRERGMTYHLQRARAEHGAGLVALVGAAHVRSLRELLPHPAAVPLARQTRTSVEVRHLHPDSLAAVLPDPPLAHAVWEVVRDGAEPPPASLEPAVSRRVELVRDGLRLVAGAPPEDSAERSRAVLAYAAHHACRRVAGGRLAPDRAALVAAVWRVAAASWHEQTRETPTAWQRRLFFDFARRYARIEGLLVPGLYEQVVAARGVADDNLAWELFEAARAYPWQEPTAELATARVDRDLLHLGARTVRFRRRFFRVKQRPVAVPVRRRPAPDDPAEWLDAFTGDGLCSYPPEDIVVEDYGRFLQKKAVSILSAERARSVPFTTSTLDGIDVRETLRHLHEGGVWVRELGRAPGDAGSVVVIFDPDAAGDGYPYVMTWLGEHDQESDMALYATDPTRQIVGPGIMRATYGGFLMTYPPGRLFDVWRDPDYGEARSKPEVLLMAGVDYSREKLVVHVGAEAPPSRLQDYAARQGKRIVHVPIGSLSPTSLRRLRVVHILGSREARSIAKDYVW